MSVSLLISKPIIKQKYIFGSYYTHISVSSQISLADSLSYLCIEYILQDVYFNTKHVNVRNPKLKIKKYCFRTNLGIKY